MNGKKIFSLVEEYIKEIEDKKLLENIQGYNPIHKNLKEYLAKKRISMDYYIYGDYLFNSDKLKKLISNNWKDGLIEGEHFYRITTLDELAIFDKKLTNSSLNTLEIEKDRIRSLLNKNLTQEEQEEAINLVISAKNLKGKAKYLIMEKTQKYVDKLGTLNILFGVNKNFFNEYSKK